MSDQIESTSQAGTPRQSAGRIWPAVQISVTFVVVVLLVGLSFAYAAVRFQLLDSFRSAGGPSISILIAYYLVVLPILCFAGLMSLYYYRPISLGVFALLTFVLSCGAPHAF